MSPHALDTVSPMSDELDYEKLLARALDNIPEEDRIGDVRWAVPAIDLMYEGRTTVWKNFGDIMDTIRRDPIHVLSQILRSMGSAGSQEGRRVVFKSVITADKLKEKLDEYVTTYVICGECGKPDTHLIKESRTQVIACEACGAKRPVKVKKGLTAKEARTVINVGDELDVFIQDVGRMGDGLAKIERYTIYVPGVAKGAKVKIKVEKVSGDLVIGHMVGKRPV